MLNYASLEHWICKGECVYVRVFEGGLCCAACSVLQGIYAWLRGYYVECYRELPFSWGVGTLCVGDPCVNVALGCVRLGCKDANQGYVRVSP